MRRVPALAASLALAGCSAALPPRTLPPHALPPQAVLPAPTGDRLVDAAALLLAAERAGSAEARAPMIQRLDALQVASVEGSDDDPLSAWRAEHASDPALVFRGRALGPAYRRERLGAGESVRIQQVFYAGQSAELVAETDGADVALAVENPRAEAVCAATIAPRANCRWLPLFTERFSIALENRGTDEASIYIVFR